MTDDLALLNQLVEQADETLAFIAEEATRDLPPADHPVWKRLARAERHVPRETPADSILNASGGTQAPVAECMCQPVDLPHLRQEPRVDLAAGVLRCATCGSPIPRSARSKRITAMRRIIALYQRNPEHVDVADLKACGWLL